MHCTACAAPITPGARFCHRCGAAAPAPAGSSSSAGSNALPWSVAGVALIALIILASVQSYSRRGGGGLETPPGMAAPRPPDISTLSPAQRAERLYDRIMGAAERGRMDTVQLFLPMALDAYAALGALSADQRYDLGRLADVAGNAAVAGAHADTILAAQPRHLLGLLLAARAARLRGDETAAANFLRRLAAAEAAERAKQLPEYQVHQEDIDLALMEWLQRPSR